MGAFSYRKAEGLQKAGILFRAALQKTQSGKNSQQKLADKIAGFCGLIRRLRGVAPPGPDLIWMPESVEVAKHVLVLVLEPILPDLNGLVGEKVSVVTPVGIGTAVLQEVSIRQDRKMWKLSHGGILSFVSLLTL